MGVKKAGVFSIMFLMTVLLFSISSGAVPQTINYQGYLTDSGGTPVDGTVQMTFRIYDVATGGIALWTETQSSVTVSDGIYSVVLGSVTPISLSFDTQYFLGIEVETDGEMIPRQALTSVGYAFSSNMADTAADADTVDGKHASDLLDKAMYDADDNSKVDSAETADSAINADMVDGKHDSDFAAVSHSHSGSDITTGTVAEARIDTAIARDSEIMPTVLGSDGPGSGLDADLLDGQEASAFASSLHSHYSLDAADGSPTKAVYVDNNGNVGIGTTAPAYRLDVRKPEADVTVRLAPSSAPWDGTAHSSLSLFKVTDTDWGDEFTEMVKLTTSSSFFLGSVGIGTTSPGSRFSIGGTGSSNGISIGDDQTTPVKLYHTTDALKMIAPNNRFQFGSVEYIEDCGGSCIAIGGGSVGIGTTSPGAKLHVVGSTTLGSVMIAPDESSNGDDSELFLAEDDDGTYGMKIMYDGGDNRMYIYGKSSTTTYGPHVSIDRNSGNVGIGTTNPPEELTVRGNILIQSKSTGANVMELGEGLDYAEGFDVSDESKINAGMVLVIDSETPGKLKVSDRPYDTRVAGIVAGAKGIGSGVRLGADQFDSDVALAGRVYCNVDATEAGVEPGDLLTTSSTAGYAMKATDYSRAQGAILGKAMEKLEKGKKGQILVLVTLQ